MTYSRSLYNSETRNTARFINDGDTQTIGTYFNWKTATGGMGDMTNTSRPNGSICPKGWQLPVVSNDKSYQYLIATAYSGVTGDASSTYKETIRGAHIYAMSQALRRAPLSMPLSGSFQFTSGKTAYVASAGLFWSSTSYSAIGARSLYFGSNVLYPQNTSLKGNGFPVRCVVEKSELYPKKYTKKRKDIIKHFLSHFRPPAPTPRKSTVPRPTPSLRMQPPVPIPWPTLVHFIIPILEILQIIS